MGEVKWAWFDPSNIPSPVGCLKVGSKKQRKNGKMFRESDGSNPCLPILFQLSLCSLSFCPQTVQLGAIFHDSSLHHDVPL